MSSWLLALPTSSQVPYELVSIRVHNMDYYLYVGETFSTIVNTETSSIF